MKHYLLSILLLINFTTVNSQEKRKIIRTNGEAQIEYNPKYETLIEVQQKAEKAATVNALEKAFGVIVVQGNTTYIKNISTGKKTKSEAIFNMIGNTMVKGEVLEVVKKKFKTLKNKKKEPVEIYCKITIKAREISENKLDIKTICLSKEDKNFATNDFFDGSDFFLFFQSPKKGYLTVYLDDGKEAQRLLPYNEMPEKYSGGVPINSDKEYIFFSDSPEYNTYRNSDFEIDTYELYANEQKDINRIIIIFSENEINKPRLKKEPNEDILTTEEKEQGYNLPPSLKSGNLQRWLIKNRCIREDIQVEIKYITISKQ